MEALETISIHFYIYTVYTLRSSSLGPNRAVFLASEPCERVNLFDQLK